MIMDPKIVVYEPNMNSIPHSEINAGLLSIFENIWEKYSKIIYADKRHIKSLKTKKDLGNWSVKFLKTFNYTPYLFLINDLFLIFKIHKILKEQSNENSILIFLGIMPLSHIYLSRYNKRKKRTILVCLHGQMEAYLPNTKIGKSQKYYQLSKNIFKEKDYIKYIVFGNSIKENLKFLFSNESKIITIDQPYIYPIIKNKSIENEKLVLGFIGRADKTKNIGELYSLIDILKKYILSGRVKIKVIGKFNYNIPSKYNELFTYFTSTVEDNIFREELDSIDFALSFTGKEYYRATPSGTFFDCVKWEIPLLTLENDFTNYYFNKYGLMGKSFQNTKDMGYWIKSELIQKGINKEQLLEIQKSFKRLKEDTSINSLAIKLAAQL